MRWPELSDFELRRRVAALPRQQREAAQWFLSATDRLAMLWTAAMLAGLAWGDPAQVGGDLLASVVGVGGALLLRCRPWPGDRASRAVAVYWLRWARLVPSGLLCSAFWALTQFASSLAGTPPGSLSLVTLPGALLVGQTASCLLDLLGKPPPRRRSQRRQVRWGVRWTHALRHSTGRLASSVPHDLNNEDSGPLANGFDRRSVCTEASETDSSTAWRSEEVMTPMAPGLPGFPVFCQRYFESNLVPPVGL
jgi:hypothetical protein